MTNLLAWAIVLGGPILGAIAGGVTVHYAERIHWHRLAQTWYDDGFNAGWAGARKHYGTMVPDMVFTQEGTLEALPPAELAAPEHAVEWDTVLVDLGAEFAKIKASLYTP